MIRLILSRVSDKLLLLKRDTMKTTLITAVPMGRQPMVSHCAARELIVAKYPWAKPWIFKVSIGLVDIVLNLLAEIEEIVGDSPAIEFLRVTEIPVLGNDISRTFQREIRISLQPGNISKGREDALTYSVGHAIDSVRFSCCFCGNKLESKLVRSAGREARRLFTFLPKDAESQGNVITRIPICLSCAKPVDYFNDASQPVIAELFLGDAGMDDQPGGQVNKAKYLAVFKDSHVDDIERGLEGAGKDKIGRIKSLVTRIRKNTSQRRLATITSGWRELCDDAEASFPNFSEVINFIRYQLALSEMSDGVLRLPPFLLIGNPGIGKTEFVLSLADAFSTKIEMINMAAAQTGSPLTGSDAYWSNSEPGMLFNALVLGDVANPLIVLDEIDKTRSNGQYDPLSGLHQLLEPRQAKQFNDLSVPELTLDASHVIWIATANSVESIAKQITDRFTAFTINEPSPLQMTAIASNQYRRFIVSHPSGMVFEPAIRESVLEALCAHHPRKVRKILEQAFGLAAYDHRNYLTPRDIRICEAGERSSGIGFVL